MKVLFHIGLGDTIATAAIIAKLAIENEIVEVPCWEHNLVSVKSIFSQIPNVIILPFKTEADLLAWGNDAELKLGHYNAELYRYPEEDFVQWFYRQAEFDLSEKDKHCPIKKALDRVYNPIIRVSKTDTGFKKICYSHFYHDDKARDFIIPVDRPLGSISLDKNINDNILCWHDILENAKEIHCIDSSFLHLVECIPTKAKLFYHKYARPNSTDYKYLQKHWEVIE